MPSINLWQQTLPVRFLSFPPMPQWVPSPMADLLPAATVLWPLRPAEHSPVGPWPQWRAGALGSAYQVTMAVSKSIGHRRKPLQTGPMSGSCLGKKTQDIQTSNFVAGDDISTICLAPAQLPSPSVAPGCDLLPGLFNRREISSSPRDPNIYLVESQHIPSTAYLAPFGCTRTTHHHYFRVHQIQVHPIGTFLESKRWWLSIPTNRLSLVVYSIQFGAGCQKTSQVVSRISAINSILIQF